MYGKVYDVAIGNTPYSREAGGRKEADIKKAPLSRGFSYALRRTRLKPWWFE
jgi:hypothetical protein